MSVWTVDSFSDNHRRRMPTHPPSQMFLVLTYQAVSRNDANLFAMLQTKPHSETRRLFPPTVANPHSLNSLIIPVQCCLLVAFNSPRSITKPRAFLYHVEINHQQIHPRTAWTAHSWILSDADLLCRLLRPFSDFCIACVGTSISQPSSSSCSGESDPSQSPSVLRLCHCSLCSITVKVIHARGDVVDCCSIPYTCRTRWIHGGIPFTSDISR